MSRVIGVGVFNLMLISALFAIKKSRRVLCIACCLSGPALLFQGLSTVASPVWVHLSGHLFSVLFLGYITAQIIQVLFRARRVTADMICASLCAYLLLAVLWASVYSIIEILIPGSFYISDVHQGVSNALNSSGIQSEFSFYYSLVTLSTLGYGDVIPTTPVSRIFSMGEAVCGQIYLAVLVARLVGLQISQFLLHDQQSHDAL